MHPTERLNALNPMNNPALARKLGLGDAVQKVIHAGLNITPMPAATRAAIKGCAGCRRRAQRLNRWVGNINPFAK